MSRITYDYLLNSIHPLEKLLMFFNGKDGSSSYENTKEILAALQSLYSALMRDLKIEPMPSTVKREDGNVYTETILKFPTEKPYYMPFLHFRRLVVDAAYFSNLKNVLYDVCNENDMERIDLLTAYKLRTDINSSNTEA